MRVVYSIAWWIALPVILLRLLLRARQEPGYGRHIPERLGSYPARTGNGPILWVHAVSVGETRAAQPLIEAMLEAWPDHTILLTHMTATGRATGQQLFGELAPRVVQSYLPYDTGYMVARFLRHFRPRLCVLMETEVWPNLVDQCNRHDVPVALVNARLSERSLAKGKRFPGLFGAAAAGLACVGAQTRDDARRIRSLGAPDVHVTGSVKFDVTPPAKMMQRGEALRAAFGTRPVLLCASTREGEEKLILDALAAQPLRDVLVLMVPRHPQRFDEVAREVAEHDFKLVRRSAMESAVADDVRVVLGDSMGEMFAYLAACDVAFIGGSLLPLGGQNLIEACAVGKPVLAGPYTFNFEVVTEDAIAAGAAVRVVGAEAMVVQAVELLHAESARKTMSDNALAFAAQHRGATMRTMALLRNLKT